MPVDQNSSAALSGVNPSINPGVTSGINPQVPTAGVTDFLSSAMNPGTTDQTSPEGQIAPSPFEDPIPNATPVVGQQGDFDVGAIPDPSLGKAYVDTQYQSEPPLDASSMPARQSNPEPIMSEFSSLSGNSLERMSEVMPINSQAVVQDAVFSEPVFSESVGSVSDIPQFPPQAPQLQEPQLQDSQFQNVQDVSAFGADASVDMGSQQIAQSSTNAQDMQDFQPTQPIQDAVITADVLSDVGQDSAPGVLPSGVSPSGPSSQADQNLNPVTLVLMDEPTAPASDNTVITPPTQQDQNLNQNLNSDSVIPQDASTNTPGLDSGIPQGPLPDSPFTDAEYKYEDQTLTSGGQDLGMSDLPASTDPMTGDRNLENIATENSTSENIPSENTKSDTIIGDSISSDDNGSDIISSDAPHTPDIAIQDQLSPAVESSVDEQSSDFNSLGADSSQDADIDQQLTQNMNPDMTQQTAQDSMQQTSVESSEESLLESTSQESSDISSVDMKPQEPPIQTPQDVVSEDVVSESVMPEPIGSESAMTATESVTDTPEPLPEEVLNPIAVSPVEGSTILPIVSDVIGEQLPTDDHHGMPVTNAFYALGDSLKQLVQLGARDATTPYILQGYNDEQTHIHYAFELIDGGNILTITKTTTSLGDPLVDILGFVYDIMDFSLKVSLDGSEIYKEYEGGSSDVSRQQLLLQKLGHFQSMIDEQIMIKQQELEQQRQQAQAELEQQRKFQEDATRVSQQIENF